LFDLVFLLQFVLLQFVLDTSVILRYRYLQILRGALCGVLVASRGGATRLFLFSRSFLGAVSNLPIRGSQTTQQSSLIRGLPSQVAGKAIEDHRTSGAEACCSSPFLRLGEGTQC
jgi:hypothetical protein